MPNKWGFGSNVLYQSRTDKLRYQDGSEASGTVLLSDGDGALVHSTIAAAGMAPIGASYVVIALDGDLTSERVLAIGSGSLTLSDGGANGNVTLDTAQDIQTSASPTFAGGIFTGDVTLSSDNTTLGIGVDHTARGSFYLYGDAGSDSPEIRLYNAAGDDAVVDYFGISPNTTVLNFNADGTLVMSMFASANVTTLVVGIQTSIRGTVIAAGHTTSQVIGGIFQADISDTYNTTILNYSFRVNEDDLLIGPSNDTDSLIHHGGTGIWEFTGAAGVEILNDLAVEGGLKVGAGTRDEELHIEGGTNIYLKVQATDANGATGIRWTNDAQAWRIFTTGSAVGAAAADSLIIQDDTGVKTIISLEPGIPGHVFSATVAGIRFNEDSQDYDFTIESDGIASAFFLEGSSGNISMGADLDITGDLTVDGTGSSTFAGALELTAGAASASILFTGSSGGNGEGIQYKDAGGATRYAMQFPGSDVVQISNRAANGVVKILANTSTAGGGGEVLSATFTDTELTLTGNLKMGAATISDSSGNLTSANGVAAFGPAAVASITIVNGIVTAIS